MFTPLRKAQREKKPARHMSGAGRSVNVERGRFPGFQYLYCANTFDQRQLVIVKQAQAGILETYYQEILREIS